MDDYLSQHPEINLNDLESFWYMDNFTNPYSTIQGLLCFMAYQDGGIDKLKKLMMHTDTYIAIEKEFGIGKDGLNEYLREQVRKYKN